MAIGVKRLGEAEPDTPVLIYDDATGQAIELDTRGTDDEVVARLSEPTAATGRTRPSGRRALATAVPHSLADT